MLKIHLAKFIRHIVSPIIGQLLNHSQ